MRQCLGTITAALFQPAAGHVLASEGILGVTLRHVDLAGGGGSEEAPSSVVSPWSLSAPLRGPRSARSFSSYPRQRLAAALAWSTEITLDLRGQRIRLHGVDAPERDQLCQDGNGRNWRCGASASSELQTVIGPRTVECFRQDTDRYGRMVARCKAGETDLGKEMVLRGFAVAYSRYSMRYVPDQVRAWAADRGIWEGNFERPEDWRRRL